MKNIDFGFVADIYDAYVAVDFDIDFFKQYAKAANGKCLELMCGTGRVSIPLLMNDIDLTCVDYSNEMLEVLKNKTININNKPKLVCEDVCKLKLNEEYKLIFIPFNSFSEIIAVKKQRSTLKIIYEHLADDGKFICTLYNPSYRQKIADGQYRVLGRYSISNNKTMVISYYNNYDAGSKLVSGMQFYEIYDSHNTLVDKRFLDITCSLIDKETFIGMAAKVGFLVKDIFGDYNSSPYTENSMFMNFVLTKR